VRREKRKEAHPRLLDRKKKKAKVQKRNKVWASTYTELRAKYQQYKESVQETKEGEQDI